MKNNRQLIFIGESSNSPPFKKFWRPWQSSSRAMKNLEKKSEDQARNREKARIKQECLREEAYIEQELLREEADKA